MPIETSLLIIGAGPFGLALSAYAGHLGIDHLVVGEPMGFWKTHMPKGMYLRSACDWHLDPTNIHTIERYLDTQQLSTKDVEPLSLEFYLGYTRWFQEQKQIKPWETMVLRLNRHDGSEYSFAATTANGDTILARQVVLALGFEYFKHIPQALTELVPAEQMSHTCDLVDFTDLNGKRCLIVGGRQSAFEWAALLQEAGASAVHVSHRHPSPAFAEADWSWVNPLLDAMVDDPTWFRNLPFDEQDAVKQRLWGEGRLKVEPWLEVRLNSAAVRIWPESSIMTCDVEKNGDLRVRLDTGTILDIDHIICATGYRPAVDAIPFLAAGDVLPEIETRNGFPVLDDHFQTAVPGLFMTSMLASQDFGPFFGFTVAVRTSARLIGKAIATDRQ